MTNSDSSKAKIYPNLLPTAEAENEDFSTIRQGTSTNTLTKISTLKSDVNVDQISGTATISKGNLTLSITKFTELAGFKSTTHQLLDALITVFTETGAKEQDVSIDLEDYMALRGLKDKKTARKQVKADLETLYSASISFTEKVKGKPTDFLDFRLIDSKGIKKGVIRVSFANKFYNRLKEYPIMSLPNELYRLNGQYNPHSYYFLRKISEHKNMNLGKKNEDIIAVKTLLDASPELPTYEDVKATDRAFNRRIIEPFDRDMDALENTLTWHYCKRNGTPLTDKELESLDYDIFSKLLIKCSWHKYPDKTKRLEKIAREKKNEPKLKRPTKKGTNNKPLLTQKV